MPRLLAAVLPVDGVVVVTGWLGRLQAWLHGGYPPTKDPFPGAWRLGNLVSSLRYWTWRARGGKR